MMHNIKEQMTREQRVSLGRWFAVVVTSELFMLWRHLHLVMVYGAIAIIFCVLGMKKKIRDDFNVRQGSIRDFISVIIALVYAGIAMLLNGSPFRFGLILCSSVIIMPHLAGILKKP